MATAERIIAKHPPADGRQWDCQCARCGSSVERTQCDYCEDGYSDHECGEDTCCCLHPEMNVPCDICNGEGGWWTCLSASDWCHENPLPGREDVQPGTVEWFPE